MDDHDVVPPGSRRPRRVRVKEWLIPALFGVAGLYGIKAGPFRPSARPSLHSAGRVTSTTRAAGATTGTTFTLERLNYHPGDCVQWDQAQDGPGTRDTSIVPCDAPHLIEIAGRTLVSDQPAYPTEAEWTHLTQTGECAALATAYIGGVLDPYGRFGIGAIHP
ncbi:MAG TPA: septum formation family protein, partial [Acidimicrobiia bacterium]|nr:septum formation family protein [Acidimicrobiia bacterium]